MSICRCPQLHFILPRGLKRLESKIDCIQVVLQRATNFQFIKLLALFIKPILSRYRTHYFSAVVEVLCFFHSVKMAVRTVGLVSAITALTRLIFGSYNNLLRNKED